MTVNILGEDMLDAHEIHDPRGGTGENKTRKLTDKEKDEYRAKIRADIEKYSKLAAK